MKVLFESNWQYKSKLLRKLKIVITLMSSGPLSVRGLGFPFSNVKKVNGFIADCESSHWATAVGFYFINSRIVTRFHQ